jgi:hypothetical protein
MTQAHEDDHNPAARVYRIVMLARREDGGTPTRTVWAKAFGLDPKDAKGVLGLYLHLLDQIDLAASMFENTPAARSGIYARHLGAVRSVLSTLNLEAHWKLYAPQFTDAMMVGLEFCAHTLGQQVPEKRIPQPQLDAILDDVNALLADILQAELDLHLKKELVRGLERVRAAVVAYNVGGAEGLREAMDEVLGISVRHYKGARAEDKSAIDRAVAIVEKINTVVTFALNMKELAAPIAVALLGRLSP